MAPKEAVVTLRISIEDKATIEQAALAHGQTVTTFVLRAALQKAKKTDLTPRRNYGTPTFFKALCLEASQGGSFGYRTVGKQFAATLGHDAPYDIELDEWQEILNDLSERLNDSSSWQPVFEWFAEYFPNCWKLVPKRRRESFAEGVADYAEEGGFYV